ncbi:MAG TPA: ATP-binding protein, partial [Anaerolineales bacterium]|nr:ATP-binding protein [Anaerolineales bacterium]
HTENQLRQNQESLRHYAEEIAMTNRELAEARDRALEASQLKSTFLATMSHEIRTPMNAILGMGELLLNTDLNEEQREFASIIDASARNLLNLLNDILDFSKIEAGKIVIRSEAFSLRAAVQETVRLFQPQANEKQLTVELIVDANLPETLVGDAGRIRQVLSNLISNAIKFTEIAGAITISLSGTCVHSNVLMATLSVQDTGSGIPDGLRPYLFEPFTQADGTNTRKHGGSGLGLAISQRLVRLMQGEIGYESMEGNGSTFWFRLPLSIRPEPKMSIVCPPPSHQPPAYRQYAGHKPILVVDDSLINRDLVRLQLKEFGLRSQSATNGQEAVELLKVDHDSYAMVLMDLYMPEMDGFTAAQLIRQNEAGKSTPIPLVALTASVLSDCRESCSAVGMNDFLRKPVSLADLDRLLAKWLKDV